MSNELHYVFVLNTPIFGVYYRMAKRFLALLVIFTAAAAFFACQPPQNGNDDDEPDIPPPPLVTGNVQFHRNGTAIAGIDAEIADTHAKRQQGLMHRTELADGHGMIFVFEHAQVVHFWMENTSIPLSIAFVNNAGTITSIKDMQPFDKTFISSQVSVIWAIEVPQGWFGRAGVKVGDKVIYPAGE